MIEQQEPSVRRWNAGETVVLRYQARDGAMVASGYPTTCVEDSEERLVLFLPHDTTYIGYDHLPLEGRVQQVIDRATKPQPPRRRQPHTWRNHTLRFLYPGEPYQVWAAWREDSWDFAWWYVNLEAPFVRTEVGIDTRDHTLDIVASPDLEWRWKDEDELEARVEHGIDTAEFAAAVRVDGERAVELIERAAPPFDEPWPDWRPDRSWVAPELPEGWADVPAPELELAGMTVRGVTEIGDQVYRVEFASGLSSHSGIVVGDDCAVVIDTGMFEADARILEEAVASVTDLPTRYVINTHHHGDHTFGNWWFRPAVAIGHRRCRVQLVGEAGETHRQVLSQWMPAAAEQMAAVPIDPPAVTFEVGLRLHLGRVTLRLEYFGRAHTDNDIAIAVEEQGINFVGDVVGETLFGEDAYLDEWAPTLRRLLTVPEQTFQPGHDPLVDRAFIESQVQAIEGLARVCGSAAGPEEALASASEEARAAFGSQLETSVRRFFEMRS